LLKAQVSAAELLEQAAAAPAAKEECQTRQQLGRAQMKPELLGQYCPAAAVLVSQ
jgi:hypothetical protein